LAAYLQFYPFHGSVFWAVFTCVGSGPALTAHGSLDLKQEIQIQFQIGGGGLKKWKDNK
jgi:hypothetical protein